MTAEQRSGVENGIWLCRICSGWVDKVPDAFPVETLRAWKRYAEQRAARQASASGDLIAEIMGDLDKARDALVAFSAEWRANEPPYDSDDWNGMVNRMQDYSQRRLGAYAQKVAPLLVAALTKCEVVLGNDPALAEAQREAFGASVNYIAMSMMADQLTRLRTLLELR